MTTPTDTTAKTLKDHVTAYLKEEAKIKLGGGTKAIERQHEKGRLTARERVEKLIDPGSSFQELGLWAAHNMYAEYGGAPAAGVVTGIGSVQGRLCMIIANDATVKAGAFFPMTCKKIIRAQTIAHAARLPLIYLVDSAGVFLPMQEDVFPDTDDFGRIFRNNAVISADGIPQIAAIMGYCVAGGGYLPVLCDTLLMTEGSGLYLAGPALVKAAIGQQVTDEELGGASMHASISGTIDFKEPDDDACIRRVRELVGKYGAESRSHEVAKPRVTATARSGEDLFTLFTDKPGTQYDVKEIIGCLVDSRAFGGTALQSGDSSSTLESGATRNPDFDEYKADYGQSLVCGYGKIGGHACGIVANQKKITQRQMPGGKAGPSKFTNMPGVIYDDSADKAARFIMDCNQRKIPIIFLHDTTGFMVGRDSEQGGIIRAGAKMVNAMSNCIVPKIVVVLGGSYGAGNYAMCGRAFDQFLSFAWPGAKCAVMGANQATGVLATIEEASRKRKGETIDDETHKQILAAVHAGYTEQADIRHAAARGWVDRIIEPHKTRDELIAALNAAAQGWDYTKPFKTGVLQT
ncbi:MAG: acyl-CoA carboxylase subunit beta [Phycisphaeraceae bacterium]|nr:MAG: acyl-CoA carboxylase subunit beta [Phycisphaeraceae bacterium]